MHLVGTYDVVVVGAGMSGIVASLSAAREGARTALMEASENLGGLITGGRLTKPHGLVQPGSYRDLIERAVHYGGASPDVRESFWGQYTGMFDPEVMQRVIIEMLEERCVDVLLNATATGVLLDSGQLHGVLLQAKTEQLLALGSAFIDTTGDGDLAVLAGAGYMHGRKEDGGLQPMGSYFRLANVDLPALARYCQSNRGDLLELILPRQQASNEDFVLDFMATGFGQRIAAARDAGFDWIVPRTDMSLKAGRLPGEVNVNGTRFYGDALDFRTRTNAVLALRKQAHCIVDFLQEYIPGFERVQLLDTASTLGIRETRRIITDYVLSGEDVRGHARFADAIGLCNSPIDVHASGPGEDTLVLQGIGGAYGIPFRCLLPVGVDRLLVAGRCIGVDSVAFASTRNTPGCAITAEAAGIACAGAAAQGIPVREFSVPAVQSRLEELGVALGAPEREIVPTPAW